VVGNVISSILKKHGPCCCRFMYHVCISA